MNSYEAIIAFDAAMPKEKIEAIISKYEDKVKGGGGTVEKTDHWGLKKIPFKMQKHKNIKDVYYIYMLFKSDSNMPNQLVNLIRVTEGIVRFGVGRAVEGQPAEAVDQPLEEVKVEIEPSMLNETVASTENNKAE